VRVRSLHRSARRRRPTSRGPRSSTSTSRASCSAASGIEAWPEGQALPIFAEALSEPLLVAYRDADLARLGVRDDPAGAARERLRAPAGCEQPLPAPAWAARWSVRGELVALDAEALAEVPALTSGWVTTRCAPLASGALSVDVTCEDRHCAHALRSTGECEFEVEFSGCTRAPVTGAIFANGELCLGPEADAPACPVEAVVPPGEPPFLLDRVELVPTAQERLPDFLTFNGLLIPDVMSEGWAHDLELVGGYVAVVVGDGTFGGPCRGDYSRTVRVELWDPQTLTLASTATVPPCLTAIASLGGSGFVGAYSSERAWRLGRFDVTGRLVASAPIDDRTTRGAGEPRLVTRPGHRVLDVEHLAGAGVVAVLFNLDGDDGKTGDGGNIVFTYDVETLARRGGFENPDGQRWVMTPVDDRTLALPRNDARAIEWLDVITGPLSTSAPLRRLDGVFGDDSLLDVALDASSTRLLVAGTRNPLLYTVAPRGAALGRAHVFDRDVAPVTMTRWPRDPALTLVAGVSGTGDEPRAEVMLLDAARPAFLAGTWDVGWGMPTKLVTDEEGRIFVLLPWSGALVRLTPRPQGSR
jgi:hypothetical protein